MHSMNPTHVKWPGVRRIAALGLLGSAIVGLVPLGCGSSIERVPLRYREETKGPRLPDIIGAATPGIKEVES